MSAAPAASRCGLFCRIALATVLGLGFGLVEPGWAAGTHWAMDVFMRLVAMVVGPLMFCIVTLGIVDAGSLRQVGRLGLKALLYFEAMTTLALLGAVGIAMLLRPGAGIDYAASADDLRAVSSYAANGRLLHQGGLSGMLLDLVPASPVAAFASGSVLQILAFAILFGCCLGSIGEAGAPVVAVVRALGAVFSRMMRLAIALAPIAVFGAMATTSARYGIGVVLRLAGFTVLAYAAIGGFVLLALGLCLRLSGLPVLRFWRYLRAELLIVAATSASDTVLASIMLKLEQLGVDRQVVGLVVPAGYSFNLDALSIYLGLALPFLAQATHTHLGPVQLLSLLAAALLTSKGAHGVPGIAIVILAATLQAVPAIPPACIALLLVVEWFVGIARSVGNLAGNCVAPVVIAAWEGRLDRERARRVLDGGA